jgi:hypothetical protein
MVKSKKICPLSRKKVLQKGLSSPQDFLVFSQMEAYVKNLGKTWVNMRMHVHAHALTRGHSGVKNFVHLHAKHVQKSFAKRTQFTPGFPGVFANGGLCEELG